MSKKTSFTLSPGRLVLFHRDVHKFWLIIPEQRYLGLETAELGSGRRSLRDNAVEDNKDKHNPCQNRAPTLSALYPHSEHGDKVEPGSGLYPSAAARNTWPTSGRSSWRMKTLTWMQTLPDHLPQVLSIQPPAPVSHRHHMAVYCTYGRSLGPGGNYTGSTDPRPVGTLMSQTFQTTLHQESQLEPSYSMRAEIHHILAKHLKVCDYQELSGHLFDRGQTMCGQTKLGKWCVCHCIEDVCKPPPGCISG